jgi:chromosome segregation ATPase
MSVRSTPKPTTLASPAAPIQFREDFVHSTAALAASHDESVRNILSRLDMLQSKVSASDEEPAARPRATPKSFPSKTPTPTLAADASPANLHSRISNLETIHQDHLARLGAQLNAVEDQLSRNGENNPVIHEISSKFGQIESHVRQQSKLSDRLNNLESQFASIRSSSSSSSTRNPSPTKLHARINSLESEIASLRASTEPHPDQERLLRKINARLDEIETKRAGRSTLGSRADEPLRTAPRSSPGVAADRQQYLAARIDKLKELRSRYE